MSLTLALAILGAIVLAAVLAHGLWSARRAGPKQATAPVAPPAAVTREPELIEPTLAPAPAPEAKRRSSPRLDALIDAIVPLALEQPLSGEAALPHLPASRRAGSKPFLIEGLSADDGEWEVPQPGRRYSEFQAGVQMANRGGAINEIEYSEFVQKAQAFADSVGALMGEPPDMLDVVARSRELDAFASEHDAQLAVRLKASGSAWSVGFLVQHAARYGFVAGAVPGRLVQGGSADDGTPPVLTLSFDPQAALADDPAQAVVAVVSLALDVPQIAAAAEPFTRLQQTVAALAADLDAELLDDAGQPLNVHAFATIGRELGALYAALQARDLAAGSPAARRLFS